MNSIDPRINRLPKTGQPGEVLPKGPMDQFGTFEVFVQPKEGKPFQHEGIVHAPDIEMAFVLAKEAFTRRFSCVSLSVAETRHVFVSPLTEGTQDAYDLITEDADGNESTQSFEIYHLLRRGKQHIHAATVQAKTHRDAMLRAKEDFKGKSILNIWAIRTDDIRFTSPEEKDLWITLPEKKFRDAADYKGGDKLREYLQRNQSK